MDFLRIKDLKDLQSLLDLMRRNDLAELEIEAGEHRIRLRKSEPHVIGERVVFGDASAPAQAPAQPAPAGEKAPPASPPATESSDLFVVPSPLVGTFYRAPSPEADPYVQVGDRVDEDSVLAIVEAMKVMNEIRSGVAGIVREVLAKNGEPVEYGQPLFRLEPM
ncbi:MAG TPA: acetyl-CoA carboxylase biotin carboxyl carrier protein [Planctomycetota bacterium]|nr:acetyl-CoA carboxylase biotin carboxyl carrier protein [Planctomycetota bacterium]